jgi:hypothetical protein
MWEKHRESIKKQKTMNFKEDLLQQPQAQGVHEESSLIKDNQSMYNRKTLLRIKTEIENELNKMQESEPEENQQQVKVDKRPVQRIKTYAVNDDPRTPNKTPIKRLQTSMKLQHEREVEQSMKELIAKFRQHEDNFIQRYMRDIKINFSFAQANGSFRDEGFENCISLKDLYRWGLENKIRFEDAQVREVTSEPYVSQDAFIDLLVLASSGGITRNVGITNFTRLMEHLGFEQKEPSINRSFDIERDDDAPE